MAWSIDCRIWGGLDWDSARALILALGAIEVCLPIISLKRLNVLSLCVVYIGNTTWAGLAVALVMSVGVINGLSNHGFSR